MKVSSKCGISTAMAAVAVQAVCEELYHHQYYLTKEEAIEKDPNLHAYQEQSQPKEKRRRLDAPKSATKPLANKQDYIPYKDVLPSPRTLNDHKQLLAVQAKLTQPRLIHDEEQCPMYYALRHYIAQLNRRGVAKYHLL